MLKGILAIAIWLFASISYADLGAISLSSYLGQNLNAKISVTNLAHEIDYTNLKIGLAAGDKFKEYGLPFSPELGYLLFNLVTKNNQHYIQITSSRPLNSPVLSFLLHYKLNNNDFYRQYTLLLDPIDYAESAKVIPFNPGSDTAVIQAQSVIQTKERTPYSGTPDSDFSHSSRLKAIKIANHKQASTPQATVYAMDFNQSYVQGRLANFNRAELSYLTQQHDTLYNIARFEQLLYPLARFSLSQVILALALKNYPYLHPLSYSYESGVKIFLADPPAINKISTESADAYLFDFSLSPTQRQALLHSMITSLRLPVAESAAILFAVESIALPQHKFNPPLVTPLYEASFVDKVFSHIGWLLAGLILVLGLFLLAKKMQKLNQMAAKLNLLAKKTAPVASEDDNFTIHKIEAANLSAAALSKNGHQFAASLALNSSANVTFNNIKSAAEPKFSSVKLIHEVNLDEELIATLEQILAFDDSRDDIRFKLFELYVVAKQRSKALESYHKLDTHLESDDKLRFSMLEVCSKYSFEPEL